MNEDIRKLNSNERFCCQQMIDEGWYVSMQSDKSIRLEDSLRTLVTLVMS
jgi:hypothetical protein